MGLEDRIEEILDDPDARAKIMIVMWVSSFAMVVLGYLILMYLLFSGEL
jgi:hypothetical protein